MATPKAQSQDILKYRDSKTKRSINGNKATVKLEGIRFIQARAGTIITTCALLTTSSYKQPFHPINHTKSLQLDPLNRLIVFLQVKLSSLNSSDSNPLRPRSQTFEFTRQLYPPSLRSIRLSLSTRGLPPISEHDRPLTADATRWDSKPMTSGQLSPTRSTAQFSSTSSWFPGSVQKHHLGRKDVVANIRAFEQLAKITRQYEDALRNVADASTQFAEALEQFSRVKDLQRPDDDEDNPDNDEEDLVEGFRSLSGYQFYMGNQQQVLAQLIHEHCTSPLEAQFEAYRNTLTSLHKSYSKTLGEQTVVLKQREKQHISHVGHQDLSIYRRGLEDLSQQLDALDQLKYGHYETVAEHTRQVWSNVLKHTTIAARAHVDILEKVSDKGLQNDILGRMIATSGDPFDIPTIGIVDQIKQSQVVLRPLTPVDELPKPPSSLKPTDGDGGDSYAVLPTSTSAPTAPSPPTRPTDPFEVIEEVPAIPSAGDEDASHLSQSEVPKVQTDVPTTMTPPLTPTSHTHTSFGQFVEGNKKLIYALGEYVWGG